MPPTAGDPGNLLRFFAAGASFLGGCAGWFGFRRLDLGFGFRLDYGGIAGRGVREHFLEKFRLLQVFLRRRRLFVPVIMVVITRTAADLCRGAVHDRDDRVIRHPAALDAVVVDDVP
jgi:hypothetical protein